MNEITILLVDDQPLFREGLHTLLSVQPDFKVVGEAGNGIEALRLARILRPAVILMDLQMPLLDGVETTRRLHEEHLDCAVIVLTTFDDDELVFDGLRAGAIGYLLKDAPSEKLGDAVRSASRGESFLQPSVAAKVVAEFARLKKKPTASPLIEPLSEREREVLHLITDGRSNREIAETLCLAEGTVKNHITNILGKLGVRDRTQAALLARANDLL